MTYTQNVPSWLDIAIKLTPAFVTLVVGSFGVCIAFNQYRVSRDKLRLDLFDKRITAYEKLQEYFICVLREGRVKDDALPILAEARYKSFFLFGSDITDYIDEIWSSAIKHRKLHLKLYGSNSLPVGEERNKVCDEETKLLEWIITQQTDSPNRYLKYMRFQ